MTGRISTAPMRALGRRPAIRMAPLRSRASISQNPPSCSLVSVKGPSVAEAAVADPDGGCGGHLLQGLGQDQMAACRQVLVAAMVSSIRASTWSCGKALSLASSA